MSNEGTLKGNIESSYPNLESALPAFLTGHADWPKKWSNARFPGFLLPPTSPTRMPTQGALPILSICLGLS